MDFLRETYESEASDEVRQSIRMSDLELRSTPIRRVKVLDFQRKTIDSELPDEVW